MAHHIRYLANQVADLLLRKHRPLHRWMLLSETPQSCHILIHPLHSAYCLPLSIQESTGVRGNPAKTTLTLSFPGGSRSPSMLWYALCRVLLSNSHCSLPSFSNETSLTDAILLTTFL